VLTAPTVLALTALLAADPGVDVTVVAGGGPGLSPNSTVTYAVPIAAVNADANFGGWYAGGGVGTHTFIEPRFFLEELPLNRAAVDVIARIGISPFRTEHLRLMADVSAIGSVQYVQVLDAASFFFPLPTGAVDVRAEVNVTDDVYLQFAGGVLVSWASFGLIETVPHALVGMGMHFN
jgi:hypothetical protein